MYNAVSTLVYKKLFKCITINIRIWIPFLSISQRSCRSAIIVSFESSMSVVMLNGVNSRRRPKQYNISFSRLNL